MALACLSKAISSGENMNVLGKGKTILASTNEKKDTITFYLLF
ncbi:hypothetical protein BLFGPEAP_00952 [Candidatus Methanoperedenaceae archaeon GB50]|nr:hypothetical protein BLFGPEAP_00952 [Candidatus Methanoperedenaceae archaeon GB50]